MQSQDGALCDFVRFIRATQLTICAEGEALAQSMSCKFIETSAKTRKNVENAFFDIVREIRRYNKEMNSYGGSGAPGGSNGPKHEMDMGGEGGKERGCCGSCVVM